MLAGRLYRIFQRYAAIHVALDIPGAALRDDAGAPLVQLDPIRLRANRLWLTGQSAAQDVQIRINRTQHHVAPDAAGAFALDLPLETGPIDLSVAQADGAIGCRLAGFRPGPLRWARVKVGARFIWQLICLLPPIYRWKWHGDLTGREIVKERLGLVSRPEAAELPAGLVMGAAPVALPHRTATLVMPVFNAFDVLPEALDRVARHSGENWRLILVEDGSTDARVRPFLEAWCRDPGRASRVTVVTLPDNRGFVGAVNCGLKAARAWPDDPVVLLNSDALVPEGWLARLLEPFRDAAVASVTPMSNDAEIFSVPGICQRCDLAPGMVDAIDAVARRLHRSAVTVDAPTGVGFCMALSPSFLAQVPALDEVFGRGYGEENDWCQKTRALGGRHVGVGTLFVEHRGGASFGSSAKQRLIEQNLAILVRRYPGYENDVQEFVRRDPLAGARLALGLAWAVQQSAQDIPVYLAHALGGGAEFDLERRIAEDIAHVGAAVVLRVGLRQRWQLELHSAHGVTRGLAEDKQVVQALVALLPRCRIIYSCGVGDRDPVALPDLLLALAEAGGHPVEVLVHDYFPISPSYTLLGEDQRYHGVPLSDGPLADDPAHQAPRPAPLPRVSLAEWQAAWGRLMSCAAAVTTFSQASRDVLITAYPQAAPVARVVPHALRHVPERIATRQNAEHPLVIGVLGHIGVQKGARIVQVLSQELARQKGGKVVVLGYMDPDFALAAPSQVHGAYELRDLPGLVARYGITCWLIPSIWPETFSFTTHEALATGMPVFAFNLGAQGEAVSRAVAEGAAGAVLSTSLITDPDPGRNIVSTLKAQAVPTAG
ncbi:MAG: glycosyltransferase [Pseudomonadota bacterium]